MKRSKVPYRAGKKVFRRTAGVHHSHPKNGLRNAPMMRGGIRL